MLLMLTNICSPPTAHQQNTFFANKKEINAIHVTLFRPHKFSFTMKLEMNIDAS